MKSATVLPIAAIVGLSAQGAVANEIGFYVGGWVGQATKDADRTEYDAFANDVHAFYRYTPVSGGASFDDSDVSFSLLVGYRVLRYLAIEGAYAQLGQVAHNSSTSGNFPMDSGTIDMTTESETSGFSLSLLGVWPISYGWETYARGGVLFASNSFRTSITARGDVFIPAPGGNINASFSKGSDDLYAGVGLAMRFFENYDLRLEYQRIFDAGLALTGAVGDIDVASLGLTVTF